MCIAENINLALYQPIESDIDKLHLRNWLPAQNVTSFNSLLVLITDTAYISYVDNDTLNIYRHMCDIYNVVIILGKKQIQFLPSPSLLKCNFLWESRDTFSFKLDVKVIYHEKFVHFQRTIIQSCAKQNFYCYLLSINSRMEVLRKPQKRRRNETITHL